MKRFIYILTNPEKNILHVGMCGDIVKTIAFYEKIPNIAMGLDCYKLNKLVYLEEYKSETDALIRFEQLHKLNRLEKEKIIHFANPDWVELKVGINI